MNPNLLRNETGRKYLIVYLFRILRSCQQSNLLLAKNLGPKNGKKKVSRKNTNR